MTTDVNRRVLPGFSLSLGYSLFYLGLLVLLPIMAGLLKASSLGWPDFVAAVSSDRAVAAYRLTVGVSVVAAAADTVLGLLVAWVLVRYSFPLKTWLDALVDLPFALPTAVAGLVYSDLYSDHGWLGRFLVPIGIEGAYSRLGIVLVLTFIGFPFVVRTLQPVIESLEADVEEAAACLGAGRFQTVRRVLWPAIMPATITGFALSFARSLGEYGSVVFISGNMPFRTEIAPVLIVARLEEFAYAEATAIAVVLLAISLTTLLGINFLEHWSRKSHV
jgi:sulfate transport system permease protein